MRYPLVLDLAADGQPFGIELLRPLVVFDGPPHGVSLELVDSDAEQE